MPSFSHKEIKDTAEALVGGLADSPPLVQNITNWVAMDFSANVLLALGASPAMVAAQAEAAEFAGLTSALVINIGTFEETWLAPACAAAEVARTRGTPWVLDPVAVGVTGFRTENARALVKFSPTAIRANASEVLALARTLGLIAQTSHARGVDAGDSVATAESAGRALARHLNTVVCITGAQDWLCDSAGAQVRVAGGVPLLTRITASGCALSATVATFLAVGRKIRGETGASDLSDLMASALAAALFSYSAEQAAQGLAPTASGSFRVSFVDALAQATSHQGATKFAQFAADNLSPIK